MARRLALLADNAGVMIVMLFSRVQGITNIHWPQPKALGSPGLAVGVIEKLFSLFLDQVPM